MASKTLILSKEIAGKKMQRIAFEIAEDLYAQNEPLIIIGIAGSGMVIAQKLQQLLMPLLPEQPLLISCSLNKRHPAEIVYSNKIDFTNKNVLIVDDVTSTGRTLLFALKPLLEFHPRSIRTMSLVERMHKHFPIKIDYIGLSVASTLHDHIEVEVEDNEVTGAFLR